MELGHWVTGSVGHLGHLSRPGHPGRHFDPVCGSPGRWIPGSLGRWVTKCDPVPSLVLHSRPK